MERENLRKDMWNTAGKAGALLGLASAAYMFITLLMSKVEMPSLLSSALSLLLWVAKFAGCIWIMREAMIRFAAKYEDIGNRDTFRLGTLAALLSALIFSAISFANVAYISADLFTEQMQTVMQQLSPMMDSNTMAEMEKIMENLPQLTFISNLIYCFLYGTVLSAILSRNIPAKDPFADYKPQEQ